MVHQPLLGVGKSLMEAVYLAADLNKAPSTMSECVMMSLTIFSKSLSDVVDGQSSMIVSVCLL